MHFKKYFAAEKYGLIYRVANQVPQYNKRIDFLCCFISFEVQGTSPFPSCGDEAFKARRVFSEATAPEEPEVFRGASYLNRDNSEGLKSC